ncbi:ribosomal RNA small subunit methyltransferase A [Candidatus Micrarchaeota archaeon]|nr:ribosomal RNA small subunit methyltransferase A [Candidatus Micrarchaeota archaeon]
MSKTPSKNKRLGQCFLEDKNILDLEAKLAKIKGKTVLEIVAGDGRLTKALLRQNPKKVYVVEKDSRFAALLREKFNNIEVLEGDFLEIELPKVDVIIGNIPYYISSDIVFKIKTIPVNLAVLMVQKEFAQKMIAKPGDRNYGRLSVTSQLSFETKLERIVLRHLFNPVPEVDSAIILLKPTGKKLTQFEENVIRYIFQHKNKTVKNALLDSKMFTKEEVALIDKFAKKRGRTLTKEEVLEIAGKLKNL